MSNKLISMSKIRQLLRLYAQGESKNQISLRVDISRNTLKKYLKIYASLGIPYYDLEKLSDSNIDKLFTLKEPQPPSNRQTELYVYFNEFEKKLRKPNATRRQLWKEDYKKRFPGGYEFTQFTISYTKWLLVNKPVMHIEHKVGDKMYIDYAGDKLHVVDKETGEVQAVEVFISVLGASQLTYFEATESQQKEDFISSSQNALLYYGGVPQAIVPDNLKSAVIKSNKYEPTLNESFEQFAQHYSTTILPARAYKPKDKSLVEGAVKIMYNRIYSKIKEQTFFSIEELNQALQVSLEEYNAIHFTNRTYSRRELFEDIEREHLQPLPSQLFELKKQQVATVAKHGHICLTEDKHYYSVPYQYISKRVKVYYTKKEVDIFHNYLSIATHQRIRSMYGYSTLPEHLASQHRFISEWNPEKFINLAAAIDPSVKLLIERVLDKKQHPEQSYKTCNGILQLKNKVGTERLINACKLALDYHQYNYATVKKILERGLDKIEPQENEDTQAPVIIPMHPNIRGEAYYK
jgi:transposase